MIDGSEIEGLRVGARSENNRQELTGKPTAGQIIIEIPPQHQLITGLGKVDGQHLIVACEYSCVGIELSANVHRVELLPCITIGINFVVIESVLQHINIIARIAIQVIVFRSANEDVVTIATFEHVCTGAAIEVIIASSRFDIVVTAFSQQAIIAITGVNTVSALTGQHEIIIVVDTNGVIAAACKHLIIAAVGFDVVILLAARINLGGIPATCGIIGLVLRGFELDQLSAQ